MYCANFCDTKPFVLPKYGGREGDGMFRVMYSQEVRELGYGDRVWMRTTHGDARRVKINGKVRTWKRDEDRLEVSIKYGLYEYATFNEKDVEEGRFLVEVTG